MKSFVLLAIAVFASCLRNSNKMDRVKGVEEVRNTLNAYSLPYKDRITDENSFVFYKEQRWDTSFVLILRKEADQIVGVYHEVNPYNVEKAHLNGVLFFEGFQFTLDLPAWGKIINESNKLLFSPNHVPYTECLDCGTYILSHNGEFTFNGEDRVPFENYEVFLRQNLVYPYFRKKQE